MISNDILSAKSNFGNLHRVEMWNKYDSFYEKSPVKPHLFGMFVQTAEKVFLQNKYWDIRQYAEYGGRILGKYGQEPINFI